MKQGRIFFFGDNIDTDVIAPGSVMHLGIDQIKFHSMEAVFPDFHANVKEGDILIAGKNFGGGSSREQAPLVLLELGFGIVLAESFARLFFRNSINVGLNVGMVDPDLKNSFDDREAVQYSLEKGILKSTDGKREFRFRKPEGPLTEIIEAGGMVEFVKKQLETK